MTGLNKHLNRITQLICLLPCVLFGAAAAAAVTVTLDPQRVGEGETVRLTIEATTQVSSRPDTAPLEKDFEVLGVSSGNKISIVNGRTSARSTWQLTLLPKRLGELTVPPLDVAGEQTQALTVTVVKASTPTAQSGADIFLETEVDTRGPYVQAQVIYKIRLFHAVNLTDGQLHVPLPDGLLAERLGEDRRFEREHNGRRYAVIERSFALFPQTSGALQLAEPVFAGEVPDKQQRRRSPLSHRFLGRDPFEDFFTTTRSVRIRGKAQTLAVRPWPDRLQGKDWLPARALSLTEEWSPDGVAQVTLGEAITRTLTLRAEGALGTQLPDLSGATPANVNAYPDPAETQTNVLSDSVLGSRVQRIAYVPKQTGSLQLPAVELSWWDTDSDSLRQASLPARIVEVIPVPGQAPAQTVPRQADPVAAPNGSSESAAVTVISPLDESGSVANPWIWLVLALLIAWLGTLALWWRDKHTSRARAVAPAVPQRLDSASAKKRFHAACKANDAAAARAAVLQWAVAHWPEVPPKGLDALAERLADATTRRLLRELDQSLYSHHGKNWSGAELSGRLRKLPDIAERSARQAVLPELYA